MRNVGFVVLVALLALVSAVNVNADEQLADVNLAGVSIYTFKVASVGTDVNGKVIIVCDYQDRRVTPCIGYDGRFCASQYAQVQVAFSPGNVDLSWSNGRSATIADIQTGGIFDVENILSITENAYGNILTVETSKIIVWAETQVVSTVTSIFRCDGGYCPVWIIYFEQFNGWYSVEVTQTTVISFDSPIIEGSLLRITGLAPNYGNSFVASVIEEMQCPNEDIDGSACPAPADTNNDGQITPADAMCLFKTYLGQGCQ